MSNAQLEPVIREVRAVFESWGPDTSMETIRGDWETLFAKVVPLEGTRIEKVTAGGVDGEWIRASNARKDRVVLYLHGGGYVMGSVNSHRHLCERLSRASATTVLALNYRLAPEHVFPAALDDALSAYRWLLAQGYAANQLAIAGDSAGGGLSLATLLKLKIEKIPLPACAVLLSPWADLQCTGQSMDSRDAVDPMVHKPLTLNLATVYMNAADPAQPLASPVNADLHGLPPLMIHVGANETLLDDAVRIAERAEKAGVLAELKIWSGQIHVFQIFADRVDEGEASIRELGAFVSKHL